MKSKYISFLGLTLFVLGIAGLFFSIYPFGSIKVYSGGCCGICSILELEIPTNIRMSETRVLRINYWDASISLAGGRGGGVGYGDNGEIIKDDDYKINKEIIVTLYATSLNPEPKSGERISRPVTDGPCQWVWTIRPTEIGKHYVHLEFIGIGGRFIYDAAVELGVDRLPENSQIMNIKNWTNEKLAEWESDPKYSYSLLIPIYVKNIFGLNILQLRVISAILTFFGGINAVWLFQLFRTRRKKEKRGKK